ncbi:MAG: tyrosine-type recombinase/integrase [Ruminococcus sp.]|nr:tyrosine-type recombinase/integrase [Ruminococcus sp.]
MAPARKDCKGRALKKGETQRKTDLMYIYTYTDPFTHKRKYVYSKDLLTLREKEKELQRDQLDGLDIYAAGSATLNYLFDRYISTKTELRSSTRTNYTYMYNHYVRNSLGNKLIKDIKYSDIVHFYIYLVKEMRLKINTLETIHTVLNPTFKMAVRDNIIRVNPCEGAMAQMKKKNERNKGIRHALTIEQQRAFMGYIKDHPVFYRWEPLFTVLLGTGCRVGEVIGLRWKDIDLKNRMIHINHSVSYYPRIENSYKCDYRVSLPKTEAGIRNVPMMDEVYEAFLREKARQKEEDLFNHMEVDGMSGFIFCNRFGMLHNPAALNRVIRRITETYNSQEVLAAKREGREPVLIPHFSCHHLRHTFCTRFCENETNVKVIQSVMGHANIQTTLDIYAEVTDMKKAQSIENLSRNLHIF